MPGTGHEMSLSILQNTYVTFILMSSILKGNERGEVHLKLIHLILPVFRRILLTGLTCLPTKQKDFDSGF